MALPDSLRHTFYEGDIPSEIGRQLESLYESPYCLIKYFEIFRDIGILDALVISCEGEQSPRHVMAYVISGKNITVLNELVEIEQDYVQYFADTVFKKYTSVTTINFNCLKNSIVNLKHPWRLWQTSQDIAITLPRSFEIYHAQLGKQTQKHIRYYINRLTREHPDFVFHVTAAHEIDTTLINRILEMNRMRMKGKNIISGYNSMFENRITEFCRHYGLVGTVNIQGKVIAGAICYEVGNQAYLEAISHDPAYNKYNVGQVCLYLTVKHMIEQGKDSFHTLWGKNEYKYRFRGVEQGLHYISIYRSSIHKFLDSPRLAKYVFSYIFKQVDYLMNKYIINRYRQKR